MIEKEIVKQAINEVLEERHGIDSKTHAEHHKFMEMLVEEYRIKKERREKIKTQLIGWGMISTVTAFLAALGYAANQWLIHLKGGG